jgi:hypothetical protein
MAKLLLLVVGLVGLVGIGVFVFGPDTGLGPGALVVGVAMVVGSGSAWLLQERRRDSGDPAPRGASGRADPPG